MIRTSDMKSNQRGMASIIITMITMVIISLIVLGFATLSRREQRQSLDQQLSTAAFYAAESGIEDARNVIKTALTTPGHSVKAKHNCTTNDAGPGDDYPIPTSGSGNQTVLNAAAGISYTCLTVDNTPSSLLFNGVGEDSVVVPVTVDPAGPPINRLTITWKPTNIPSGATDTTSCPGSNNTTLRAQAAWNCGYGLLRADMTLTDNGLRRSDLQTNTITGFFEPLSNNSGSGQMDFNSDRNKPNLVGATCTQGAFTTASNCTATIGGIAVSTHSLVLRLNSLYQPSNLSVTVQNGANSLPVVGVQATIDSTGKAQDVLRRIQVRIPLTQSSTLTPNYAVQSAGSVCKRFLANSTYFAVDNGIVDPDTSNAMCDDNSHDP